MKNTNINEKTLELNICEEYLGAIRKDHPRAYWYGPSTQEELEVGFDASIENAEGEFLFLQFKRPLAYYGTRPKTYPYVFKVQSHQHQTLRNLSRKYPEAVQYAFPLIGDFEELEAAVPNLRSETNFFYLDGAPELDSAVRNHRVEVYPDHATFFSEPQRATGFNGRYLRNAFKTRKTPLQPVPFREFVSVYHALLRVFAIGTAPDGSFVFDSMPRALFIPK